MELPTIDEHYKPSDDEPYMAPAQLAYFRRKLIDWKKSLHMEGAGTINTLQNESITYPESVDNASAAIEQGFELRTRDRYRKLIRKIDDALERISQGEYGYCEITGEPIGIYRLEARPIATMTVQVQEKHERQERLLKGK